MANPFLGTGGDFKGKIREGKQNRLKAQIMSQYEGNFLGRAAFVKQLGQKVFKEEYGPLDWISLHTDATVGSEEWLQWVDEHPEYAGKAAARLGEFAPSDPYRISEETKQIYQSSQEAADLLRQQGEESLAAAESTRGMSEVQGAGMQRQAAEESTAAAVSSATQAGGASASTLGAIGQVQQENISSMRDQAIQTQVFRDQAEREYRQALMERGGTEVQAVSTEMQGLQELGRAKEQQIQTNVLDPFYAQQQYDLQMATANLTKPLTFWEKLGF